MIHLAGICSTIVANQWSIYLKMLHSELHPDKVVIVCEKLWQEFNTQMKVV